MEEKGGTRRPPDGGLDEGLLETQAFSKVVPLSSAMEGRSSKDSDFPVAEVSGEHGWINSTTHTDG